MPTRLPPSLDKETNDCYTRLVCSKRAPGELLLLLLLLLPPLSSGSTRGPARCLQLQRAPRRRALPSCCLTTRAREREEEKKNVYVYHWSRSGRDRCLAAVVVAGVVVTTYRKN